MCGALFLGVHGFVTPVPSKQQQHQQQPWSRTVALHTTSCPPSPLESKELATDLHIFKETREGSPVVSSPLTEAEIEVILMSAQEQDDEISSNSAEESNQRSDEPSAQTSSDGDAEESDEDEAPAARKQREMVARAALLGRGARNRSPPSSRAGQPKSTSVGARRIGSASRARQGPGSTSKVMDALRKAAQGASADSPKPQGIDDDSSTSPSSPKNEYRSDPSTKTEKPKPLGSEHISQSAIQSAIGDMLQRNFAKNREEQSARFMSAMASLRQSVGILGDVPAQTHAATLSAPLAYSDGGVVARVATPMDDFDIANLRLSVFSDFAMEQRGQFCARSCEAIANRRKRGAICLVATKGEEEKPRIHGTAECSFHEFHGTQLGQRRPRSSIVYVTEVAVHPAIRRRGIGSLLLNAVDNLAERLDVETVYLHVDICNFSAISLYERCGYRKVDGNEPVFEEFTKSLNLHDGATKGRSHHLLFKDIKQATWLQQTIHSDEPSTIVGTLGFEIPA